jgi:hypothetical protein
MICSKCEQDVDSGCSCLSDEGLLGFLDAFRSSGRPAPGPGPEATDSDLVPAMASADGALGAEGAYRTAEGAYGASDGAYEVAESAYEVPPGWHPDPLDPTGMIRWWNGYEWTADVEPAVPASDSRTEELVDPQDSARPARRAFLRRRSAVG